MNIPSHIPTNIDTGSAKQRFNYGLWKNADKSITSIHKMSNRYLFKVYKYVTEKLVDELLTNKPGTALDGLAEKWKYYLEQEINYRDLKHLINNEISSVE